MARCWHDEYIACLCDLEALLKWTKDMDVVMLYDAFTINTVLFLEDLGFCEKGEGGPFVSGGKISPAENSR